MDDLRYYIYIRKSSESEDRQVLSLESQLRELQEIASKRKLTIVEVFTESKSAKAPGRPEFNKMTERIRAGEANAILVWNPDRLSRNSVDSGLLIYLFDTKDLVQITTPYQNFTNTPNDKFLLGILWGQAKLDNDNKSVNVKRGMKAKAESGWYPFMAVPGYMNTPNISKGLRTVIKDPARFSLVRQMWEMMLTGNYTVPQIVNIANNDWNYRTLQGKPLAKTTLYDMFCNIFYAGYFYYENKLYEGKHEAMVTQEEFEKVQFILHRKNAPRSQKHEFSFGDIVRCKSCGYTVTGTVKKKYYPMKNRLAEYRYYRCTRKSKDQTCNQAPVKESELIKQVNAILPLIEIPDDFKDWALTYLHEINDHETNNRQELNKHLQSQYNSIQEKLDDLLDLKLSKSISKDEYDTKKQKILIEKNQLLEKLNDTDNRANTWQGRAEKAIDFAYLVTERFNKGTIEERKLILREIGSNFFLNDKIVLLDIEKPYFIFKDAKENPEKYSKRKHSIMTV